MRTDADNVIAMIERLTGQRLNIMQEMFLRHTLHGNRINYTRERGLHMVKKSDLNTQKGGNPQDQQ